MTGLSAMSIADPGAGFADLVHDAQGAFRALLQAMARPGTRQRIACSLAPPAPLTTVLAAVALTLLDHETSFALCGAGNLAAAHRYIAFHTGAKRSPELGPAAFVLAAGAAHLPNLEQLAQGTPEYPDRSATLLPALDEAAGDGVPVRLTGPGIKSATSLCLPGLEAPFWRQAQANHARYPLGVDMVFCLGDSIVALPRSTRIHLEGV
jgi:alpha-D-ribose 1-methylphosphonate 5-triphosphate synthase subunit PhnH